MAKADGKPPPIPDGAPFIRPITNEDMKAAMDKVGVEHDRVVPWRESVVSK